MNLPHNIVRDSFQTAWIDAVRHLRDNSWETFNLIVHIQDPTAFDEDLHNQISTFSSQNGILTPKQVAYTIFPFGQYKGRGSMDALFEGYKDKFYPWTRKQSHHGWGTYFYRMIHYGSASNHVNQLKTIVDAINERATISKSSYNMVIPYPGKDTKRKMGAPCLNYISIQMNPGTPKGIGMLAVYRNHDFLERAYGNYYGLCMLLRFISTETQSDLGPLTCISSHAYIQSTRTKLSTFIDTL